CSEFLQAHLGLDLRQILHPGQDGTVETAQLLIQTAIAQPALFVFEYALAKLWMSWGVHPQVMIGHSLGEFVAACLAGVFSLEDALSLVAVRGRLMQQRPAGAMLTVALSADEAALCLSDECSLAVINGPSLCVVSGPPAAIDDLQARFTDKGIKHRRLQTSHAFHSAMMEPILEDFIAAVQTVSLNPPTIPYLSNVTGGWITASEATDPRYWAKHLRQTVHFSEGLQQLLKDPSQILLEVGPGRTLSTLARRHPNRQDEQVVLTSVRHPKDPQSDLAFLLTTLGKLWLTGVSINWAEFYGYEQRYRLPLPTYPFERQRYWITPSSQGDNGHGTQGAMAKKSDIADWFYLPLWKQTVSPTLPGQEAWAAQMSNWLVFVDECGLGDPIIKRLEQQGQTVIAVGVGANFFKHSDGQYRLNPQKPDDYSALLRDLLAQDKIPQQIVHLWSVTEKSNAESAFERLDKAQDLGFQSLLYLAQAIGKQNFTDPIRFSIISNNVWDVTGEQGLCPEKATLLGPIKVIPKEYSNIDCQGIDVVIPQPGTRCERQLIDQLLAELVTPSSDPVIAYRGLHRWAPTFEPVQLEAPSQLPPRLKEGGIYLITGGLGGMGLVLAEYLAKTVRARLILTGRSALPARNQWEQWLATHDHLDRISRKIQTVQELENLGGEVLVIGADVTHQSQMQAAIATAQQQFGQINGVIHAAGVPGGGVIQRKTRQAAADILDPKVKGTLILDAIFKDVQLDFFVLCSSLTSILGEFGQVDYCSANAFLDAFAHYKTCQQNTFTLSVNWDVWQAVGMAVNTALPSEFQALRAQQLRQGISPQAGVDVFSRLLGSTVPQVLVSTHDLLSRFDQAPILPVLATKENADQLQSTQASAVQFQSTHPRPALSNAYVPPRNEIEQTIADIWRQLLGVDPVGIHDDFFELGGDSLLGSQVVFRIRQTLQVELPLNSLFVDPTVAGVAACLEQISWPSQTHSVPLSTAVGEREEIEL
ncbi:MAG: SDR family NAD(P)-dependent oxidoreductase, partial [Pseudanabaenales cyanobacterium]|nr:SDR family NAD(P)-dependent oxidoreductase [Pseudanabaenales cyanobacterium]